MRPMTRPPYDPLQGIERLLVDGTNLLHALRPGQDPAPAPTLVGRLRAVIPPSVRIEILFDGPPEPGLRDTRVASGVTVRHSGRSSADALAIRLVTEATGGQPEPSGQPRLLVVTDDGRLARELRARGAATIGASWLIRRLDRPILSSPSVGQKRPPAASMSREVGGQAGTVRRGSTGGGGQGALGLDADARDAEAARAGWRPGRGATTKRGNPKRGHPSSPPGPSSGRAPGRSSGRAPGPRSGPQPGPKPRR
jgi:hypothetical protein